MYKYIVDAFFFWSSRGGGVVRHSCDQWVKKNTGRQTNTQKNYICHICKT